MGGVAPGVCSGSRVSSSSAAASKAASLAALPSWGEGERWGEGWGEGEGWRGGWGEGEGYGFKGGGKGLAALRGG